MITNKNAVKYARLFSRYGWVVVGARARVGTVEDKTTLSSHGLSLAALLSTIRDHKLGLAMRIQGYMKSD